MTVPPLHSLTAQALEAKFANKQRRYQSKYNASYLHHPSPPPRLAAPPRPPNPMFDTLRAAAADLNLPAEYEQHGPAAPARRHPLRKAMLGTAATLALCGLGAGGYYAWAGQAPNGGQATINATLATFAQRFHDFAANQSLFRTLSEKVALLRLASAPMPGTGPATSPARVEAAEGPAPRPALPAQAAEAAVLAAALPGQPMPAASPPSDANGPQEVRSPGSGKPAETAPPEVAKAAPETPVVTAQQSAGLLAMVRQVGLLVRDTQAENEKLHTEVVSLVGSLQAKLTDLDQRVFAATQDMRDARGEGAQLRTEVAVLADTLQASSKVLEERLSLALARNSAAIALEPGKQQAEAASPASTSADDGKAVAAAAEAATTDSARTVPGYHVQAASFGVAVLSDASAAPGQAGGRLVTVGDQVPGVGRVTSITPHGTSWIVQTDHGTIQ